MTTNKKLLQDFANIKELTTRRSELNALLNRTKRELDQVEERISEARQVTKSLDGIAIAVHVTNNGLWRTLRTVASGRGISTREAKMYQRVNTKYWAVSVNRYGDGEQQFHGGRVIGLGDALSRKQAQAVAERWIKGDETVLEYRSNLA